ncbi:uncharacterized [Tachysurus ichikawai]
MFGQVGYIGAMGKEKSNGSHGGSPSVLHLQLIRSALPALTHLPSAPQTTNTSDLRVKWVQQSRKIHGHSGNMNIAHDPDSEFQR